MWLHHPYLFKGFIGGDQFGYITLAFGGSPMLGRNQYGYIVPAFSGS